MKKVTDLTENEVIHCSTKEEYDAICKLLHEAGYKSIGGSTYMSANYWKINRGYTCICPKEVTFCFVDFYKQRGYIIHPASDFLTPEQTKEEYAKQKAVEFLEWAEDSKWAYYSRGFYQHIENDDIKTTSELYDEFEKQQKSKE